MPTVRPLLPTGSPGHTRELDALAELRHALWDDEPVEAHRRDLDAWVVGTASTLPSACFVAVEDDRLVGFVEVGLRSHADGCDPKRPVGYLEGWYVVPTARDRGVGRALVVAAERWAQNRGCVEMASDTWTTSDGSIAAHRALGYEEVDRCVTFRKSLRADPETSGPQPLYAPALARIHHSHFGMVAEAAARTLLDELAERRGTVVELAAGSGISARRLERAGCAVHCVEVSPAMVELGRRHAPKAQWTTTSLWEAGIPRCIAVTAVGEALNYAARAPAERDSLGALFRRVHDALEPGGIFLFDLAFAGRSGVGGRRTRVWRDGATLLALDEVEGDGALTRTIDVVEPGFAPSGWPNVDAMNARADTGLEVGTPLHRRTTEIHRLRLFAPALVERALSDAGFDTYRWLHGYDGFAFPAGWRGVAASRA